MVKLLFWNLFETNLFCSSHVKNWSWIYKSWFCFDKNECLFMFTLHVIYII
jgi:hypothetical protein